MEKQSETQTKPNYRITVILKGQVIIRKFHKANIAMDTIISIKSLYPQVFIGGALEVKTKKWSVVWTLGAIKKE